MESGLNIKQFNFFRILEPMKSFANLALLKIWHYRELGLRAIKISGGKEKSQ